VTPEQRHTVANAVQVLEAMAAMCCDKTRECFYELKEQATRLRGALEEEET
jgi:hypothetical protein